MDDTLYRPSLDQQHAWRREVATSNDTLFQCNRKEKCIHPDRKGDGWLPRTEEYFHHKTSSSDGLNRRCKVCNCAVTAQWRQENPDYMPNYLADYRATHAETLKIQKRLDYQSKRGHYLELFKTYYWTDVENQRLRQRIYHAAHPQVARMARRIRRGRKKQAGGTFTAADLELQYKSQRGLCWHCGNSLGDTWHADHLVPLSRGGSNAPENIVISCPQCNLSKGAKLPQEWNGKLF